MTWQTGCVILSARDKKMSKLWRTVQNIGKLPEKQKADRRRKNWQQPTTPDLSECQNDTGKKLRHPPHNSRLSKEQKIATHCNYQSAFLQCRRAAGVNLSRATPERSGVCRSS